MTEPTEEMTTTAPERRSLEAVAITMTRVRLESSMFNKAVADYIDENKPDPLVKKQMRGWKFNWRNNDIDDNNNNNKKLADDDDTTQPTSSWKEPPTHFLSGRLEWIGDYMSIPINVLVYWNGEKEGSLFFSCTIPGGDAIKFLSPPPTTTRTDATTATASAHNNTADNDETKPKQQQSKKDMQQATTTNHHRVHQAMIERLKKDDYIQILTNKTTATANSSSNSTSNSHNNSKRQQHQQQDDTKKCQHQHHDLCEATVHCSSSNGHHLEERVHCNDTTAEALRRAVFSTADSSLDIFDFILALPLLPTKPYTAHVNTAHAVGADAALLSSSYTTGLADRAKLRLLEDAMYDACEREEEDELVQDLHITKRAKH